MMLVECIQQIYHENETVEIVFKPNQFVKYKVGQFITILLSELNVRRSYSICNLFDEKYFHILIKRIPNGIVSRYFYDQNLIGKTFTILEPEGRFNLINTKNNQVFFAAGSGIAPVIALISDYLNRYDEKVYLYYSVRNENEIIFKENLAQLENNFSSRFSVKYIFSNPFKSGEKPVRLNNIWLETEYEKLGFKDRESFYLCGTASYMKMIQFTLQYLGVSKERIRKEIFEIPIKQNQENKPELSLQNVTLNLAGKEYQFNVESNESILDAALMAKINLPHSCKAGICSACSAKLDSGKVWMGINEVLTDHELDQGWILTCTAHPLTSTYLTK